MGETVLSCFRLDHRSLCGPRFWRQEQYESSTGGGFIFHHVLRKDNNLPVVAFDNQIDVANHDKGRGPVHSRRDSHYPHALRIHWKLYVLDKALVVCCYGWLVRE